MSGRSWWQLIFLLFFIILSAIISYVRGYLEEQNDKKLERDADEGDKKAKKLKNLLGENRQKVMDSLWVSQMILLIAESALIGFAFISPLATALKKWIGLTNIPYTVITAVLLAILFSFVYMVMVRRIFAGIGTRNGRKSGEYSSASLACSVYRISAPMSYIVHILTKGAFYLFRISTEVLDEDITEDEIMVMVESGEESGNIESEQKEMIENIFDFSTATAAELMTNRTDVTAIALGTSDEEILQIIRESGYSRIPVYQEDLDTVVGILGVRSFLLNLRSDDKKPLNEICYPAYFVPSFIRADKLLADLKKNKVHMAIVLDEYGGTAGIVTMEDLLEEIVGNIYDETDDPEIEETPIEKLSDNLYRVPGTLTLDILEKELSLVFPEDKAYDTIGGMVYSALTVIPDDGSTPAVDVDGLHIEVEKIEERRIEWAKISVIPKEESDDDNN